MATQVYSLGRRVKEGEKRRSIFGSSMEEKKHFLPKPYWRCLLFQHNLDVMHVEKNVWESTLGTLLDLLEKNKDSINARQDLKGMKMHEKSRLGMVTGRIWTGSRWTRIQISFQEQDPDPDPDPRVQFCKTQIRIRGYCGSSTGSGSKTGLTCFCFFFFLFLNVLRL